MTSENSSCPTLRAANETYLGFDGVNDNLAINSVICAVILLIFFSLKAIAWNQRNIDHGIHQVGWITLFYGDVYQFISKTELKRLEVNYKPLDINMSYFQMISYSFFKLTNREIFERNGADALQYLWFLKACILYNTIDAVVVLSSVLPINYHGKMLKENDATAFVRTTMGNINFGNSNLLWIHLFAGVFLMISCLVIIRYFSKVVVKYSEVLWPEKTVILEEIGNRPLTSEKIENFFKSAIPDVEIEDIKLVYKYKRLIYLNKSLKDAEEVLTMCVHIENKENRKVYVKERCWFCYFFCGMNCRKHLKNGRKYYKNKVKSLMEQLAAELNRLSTKKLQFAFVTFRSYFLAIQARRLLKTCPRTEEAKFWEIRKATDPGNIIWENMDKENAGISITTLFINSAVFVVAVFLTTPPIIMSSFGIESVTNEMKNHGVFIFRFLPTLIVWLLSVGVSALVTYSSGFLEFTTKTALNRSVMLKTVTFLVIIIVILPSLGLTSISAIFQSGRVRWECIFLPDNGSFFVGYVTTSAFIGTIIQILRLPEIFVCIVSLMVAKSEAEKITIRKACLWDFNVGVQYSHALLIFTLVMFFSIPCPVIAPFGIIYFIFKFAVDRYNIYFSCTPPRTSHKVHSLAIYFMNFALIMQYFGLFFLIYIRGGWKSVTYASCILASFCCLLSVLCMNLCGVKLLPSWLLLPHRRRFCAFTLPDYDMEVLESPTKKVFHPFTLQRYLNIIPMKDKYGNPLPSKKQDITDDQLVASSTSSEE